jgi:hypothetical protein
VGFNLGLSCLTQGYGRNCGKPIYSGVNSNADKQTIVDVHNNLRRQVAQGKESKGSAGQQPSAANMRKMVSGVLNTTIVPYGIVFYASGQKFTSISYIYKPYRASFIETV